MYKNQIVSEIKSNPKKLHIQFKLFKMNVYLKGLTIDTNLVAYRINVMTKKRRLKYYNKIQLLY